MERPLSDTQEQQAQQLAAAIAAGAEEDILRIARTLVASDDATLFGATEFHIRDVVLRIAAKVGESFARGAELLQEMAGVRLSEATVARTTEDTGHRLAEALGQGATVGPLVVWDWQRDAAGRTVAYVTVDATGTRQQAQGGGAAEGRMAYVAGVYNPAPAD